MLFQVEAESKKANMRSTPASPAYITRLYIRVRPQATRYSVKNLGAAECC